MSKGYFEFHFCFSEPNGHEVIAFEVYFNWRSPLVFHSLDELEKGGHPHSEMMLKGESNFARDDFSMETVPLFRVREGATNFYAIHGGRRERFQIAACGSGGNWHWEVYRFNVRGQIRMLNFLRSLDVRRNGFRAVGFDEWDGEFVNRVWRCRGSLRREHLMAFKNTVVAAGIQNFQKPYQFPARCPKCGCTSNQKVGDDCIRDHHGCDGKMVPNQEAD